MKIGADPEFVVTDSKNHFIHAHELFVSDGAWGCDGCSEVGELRPHVAENSLDLVGNLRATFIDGFKLYEVEGFRLLSGHYKCRKPIGGHIHLSGFDMNMRHLSERLDTVHARLSDCIDNKEERTSRSNTGYGFSAGSGGYREQASNWIEYRRPGSWLLSPQVAFLNLWLSEATAYSYITRTKKPLQKLTDHPGCEGLIRFAEMLPDVPNQAIFLKVADKVFSHLPLDWNQDFLPNWLSSKKEGAS